KGGGDAEQQVVVEVARKQRAPEHHHEPQQQQRSGEAEVAAPVMSPGFGQGGGGHGVSFAVPDVSCNPRATGMNDGAPRGAVRSGAWRSQSPALAAWRQWCNSGSV